MPDSPGIVAASPLPSAVVTGRDDAGRNQVRPATGRMSLSRKQSVRCGPTKPDFWLLSPSRTSICSK